MNVLHNVIVHKIGPLTRVVPGCTVSKTLKETEITFAILRTRPKRFGIVIVPVIIYVNLIQ